jgi:hypothetical protein
VNGFLHFGHCSEDCVTTATLFIVGAAGETSLSPASMRASGSSETAPIASHRSMFAASV